jgi:hypothetical protein
MQLTGEAIYSYIQLPLAICLLKLLQIEEQAILLEQHLCD